MAHVAFGWVLVAGGLILLARGANRLRLMRATQHWPKVIAQVTGARLEAKSSVWRISSPPTLEEEYTVVVDYSYEVRGREYHNDRESYGSPATWDRRRAEQQLQRYPKGAAIQIWYDASSPARAVRSRDLPAAAGWEVWLGAGSAVAGMLLLVLRLSNKI